jgi:hypothetical protein
MNTLEIIREMRTDPALAKELLAVVLDGERRRPPETVKRLAESTEASQAAAIEYFGRLRAAIADGAAAIAKLTRAQNTTETQVADLVSVVDVHEWRTSDFDDDMRAQTSRQCSGPND